MVKEKILKIFSSQIFEKVKNEFLKNFVKLRLKTEILNPLSLLSDCCGERKPEADNMKKTRRIPQDTQSRSWTFTVHECPKGHEFYDELVDLINAEYVQWLIAAPEIAPSTGMPHCQGFMYTTKPVRMGQVVNWLTSLESCPRAPHVEKAGGNLQHQLDYIEGPWTPSEAQAAQGKLPKPKNEDFIELGERPRCLGSNGDRERQRWEDYRKLAGEERFDEIPAYALIQHYNSFKSYAVDHYKRPDDLPETCGVWHWGPSGSGKSHAARARDPENMYVGNANKWHCGFRRGQWILIEDVDPNHACLGHHFKLWADKYPYRAETKGSSMFIRPTAVVVTSQYHPSQIWPDKETYDAIMRRYRVIRFDIVDGKRIQEPEENSGPEYRSTIPYGSMASYNFQDYVPTPELVRKAPCIPDRVPDEINCPTGLRRTDTPRPGSRITFASSSSSSSSGAASGTSSVESDVAELTPPVLKRQKSIRPDPPGAPEKRTFSSAKTISRTISTTPGGTVLVRSLTASGTLTDPIELEDSDDVEMEDCSTSPVSTKTHVSASTVETGVSEETPAAVSNTQSPPQSG